MTQKYLFLGSMGQNRSPTVARVAEDIAKRKGLDIEMSYGGVDTGMDRVQLFEWVNQYDKIFVMEERMITERLNSVVINPRKVFCLYIEDNYSREDAQLVGILEDELKLFI